MKSFKGMMAAALAALMLFALAACSGESVDFSKLLDESVDFAALEGAKQIEVGQKWLSFLGNEANQNVDKAKEWVEKQSPEVLEKAKGAMDSLLKWGTEALEGGEDGLKSLGLDKLLGGKLPDLSKWQDILGKIIELIGGKLG